MSSQRLHHDGMPDQPSNPIHRLSELVPRLEALRAASALNQAKTEQRRGEYLEELAKLKYKGLVAEEKVEFIRNSFASLNDRIGELHQTAPRARKGFKKRANAVAAAVVVDDDDSAEMEEGMDISAVDDEEDGNYKGDGGGRYRRLTVEEEEDDERHWQQTLKALQKETTVAEYYIEMGYQMGSASQPKEQPKEQPGKQPSPKPHSEGESRLRFLAELAISLADGQGIPGEKHGGPPPPPRSAPYSGPRDPPPRTVPPPTRNRRSKSTVSPFNNELPRKAGSWPNTKTTRSTHVPKATPASPDELASPPSKRRKSYYIPLSGPRFGPKIAPRCQTCMRMRKLCDRKSPCGRCSSSRSSAACAPHEPDL
ncbi:hypothetical protein DSL72_006897 [Monilinia vaccinii-corymbosi]|uniref:Zn(2)-C6 fungal-type domain-containing protein n=1 Tax=Monilinia vaccinii-corymbosi TaxID=61207 RepID=A0A8A3PLA8_9HELO|nr:hypothetical protein DSL72_006897 [Monilinia vaccinii-corymbosi]